MSGTPTVDLDLREEHVQDLSSREAIAGFFASLGYDTTARVRQTAANLGIAAESLVNQIQHAELIADHDGMVQVYLFELTSVTVAATRALARGFRNRVGNFLFVLTSDYDRLDFVLLERFVPERATPAGAVGQRQAGIRPRVLTVERLKPGRVEMRVLRRLTYTESDPLAQYEKLLSAFTVADWSERHFNNRALFSDYYLLERAPMEPDWEDDPRDAYLAFRDLFDGARARCANKPEGQLRKELLEPAFEALGFAPAAGKSSSATADAGHVLRFPGDRSDALAVCLTYSWGRLLDSKDYTRDSEAPEENPGAKVLSLLQDGAANWAIVTNGKHWRLYSARTHSRATNYYEVDLEEVLAADDPSEAFRYFWLLFRRQAFEPRTVVREGEEQETTFLDQLLDGSEEYAKRLGERLKERVFEGIFPYLARGFVEYRKARHGLEADLSQPALDEVFQGTLTLLYRLLFLLYAEARDLLPVKEARGYYDVSLTRIKGEVAEKAGEQRDATERRLQTAYRTDSTELYDRLLGLFRIIDRGEPSLNVPVYNGGLFISEPDPDDDSPEARNARFLVENKVPDRHLAMALDLLARDEDEKTFKQAFIDYKSLGVRQLGSIYEGLLEFHLRVAREKLAICRGKKTEEVVPYREAVSAKHTIFKEGRGANAKERTVSKGAIYLENTRRERKATGSYYTPDYIVKYIVEHTVGPVLDEKFEAVRPRLRAAQKAYREAVKRREAFRKLGKEGDDPEKVANEYGHVVNELFDVKVLDPAMGSGHFLVEAVDFITDRMLDFLNAFPWNPVTAALAKTREAILREMDKHDIAIDRGRLTDVNLLKRHVLKRCIYGVDLNPMAVELAKVSLWLDCFTLGAPLSFLDHHLKCGNSLIGARVKEVEPELQTERNLFAQSQFAGLMLATELMRHVGELSDVTAQQVDESRQQFRRASDALAPYKRILDVYTSQWFGNEPIVSGRGKQRGERRPALEFLNREEADTWLQADDPMAVLPGLPDESRRVAETALHASHEHRFFHWELEFPEVWFGKGRPREVRGFDAVVGNPPYLGVRTGQHERAFADWATARFRTARGNWDLFEFFVELAVADGLAARQFGMIVPERIASNRDFLPLRELLYAQGGPREFAACGEAFDDPTVRAGVLIHASGRPTATLKLGHLTPDGVNEASVLDKGTIGLLPDRTFGLGLREGDEPLFRRLGEQEARLGDLLDIQRGMECGKNDPNVSRDPRADHVPVISGEGVREFRVELQGLYIPMGLEPRSRYKAPQLFQRSPKVLVRFVAPHPIAAVDEEGVANFNTVYNLTFRERQADASYHALAAVLNSRVVRWWFLRAFESDEELYPHIQKYQLEAIPFPATALRAQQWDDLASIAEALVCAHDGRGAPALREQAEALAAELYGLDSTDQERITAATDGSGEASQ